jgi:protein Cut8
MQSRKRKADDDENIDGDTLMSRSPSASPLLANGSLPQGHRVRSKRMRSNLSGRQLNLPRLLQTLGQDELRSLVQNICDRHPDLNTEITNTAPRPGVDAVLGVLGQYEAALRAAFPFGGRESSDYAYNRVRQPLAEFLDALRDYIPTFLPPNEPQTGLSLKFLDAATSLIHRIPEFESYQNNRVKIEAYEELSRAWAVVIQEAAKRGGGIQLRMGEWEQKLAKHHRDSSNRMEEAVRQFQDSLNWLAEQQNNAQESSNSSDQNSIRQQLLNGTFGMGDSVRIGPW